MGPLEELEALQDEALAATEKGDARVLHRQPGPSMCAFVEREFFARSLKCTRKFEHSWARSLRSATAKRALAVDYGAPYGFLGLSAEPNDVYRETFRLAAVKAAKAAGYEHAFDVIATLGELLDNVYQHSRAATTGLAAGMCQ
jgi:hypothetical protein